MVFVEIFVTCVHFSILHVSVYHLTYMYLCTLSVTVSSDQPHTPDSWPISEPLLLTNKISKPIIYVSIHECHFALPSVLSHS